MKKYFLLLLTALMAFASASAAVADLQNGYYRVVNHKTNRYIQVMDNTGSLNYSSSTADMRAIVLVQGLERVISDPATVLYLERHDRMFDIQAQSTGIYQMISTYLNLMDAPNFPGSYYAYGKKASITMYLYDVESDNSEIESFLGTSGPTNNHVWDINPITTDGDNYFGVAPRVKVGSKYYEPFFADFPFSPAAAGVKAYYISRVDEKNGLAVFKEITGTVPRSTPVFIECNSDQPGSNKLNIGGSGATVNDNKAKGVYFEFGLNKHVNRVTYDKNTMRSLGVTSDGKIGLVKGDYKYVPRNTFYVPVSSSAPAEFRLVTEEEYANLADPVYPTGITLSQTSMTITIGDTKALTATVKPDDTTNKSVTWTSSNTAVATVDAQGNVTAVGLGTATITATCQNVSATCQVTVQGIQPTSITLSATSLDLKVGQSQTITATVQPANTTDKTVTWTSSNTAVATVSNGNITAKAPGTATITAKCGNVTATCQVTVTAVAVTSVTLNQTNLDLHVGDTYNLTATVLPENATYKTVTWSSNNTAVATVDANGKVTALTAGNATITAKSGDVTATCAVKVSIIPVTSVTLSATTLDLIVGTTHTLTATVAPANATYKTVTWSSSNTAVATVDVNGKVTALTPGTATISAKSGDVTATCAVTVNIIPVTSVTLSATSLNLEVGSIHTLTATVAPANATYKTVTWSSSNPAVATVDSNGKVTAIAVGNATITAASGDVSTTCSVTVKNIEVQSVTLSATSLNLIPGATSRLTATVLPDNAYDKTVTWTSSNPAVATVNATGLVTAISVGEAVITAKAGNITATCQVTVAIVEATSVTLNTTSIDMHVGDSQTLTAYVLPVNTTYKDVTWTSSDESVARVNNGVVTAVALGQAVITATCGNVSATCTVTVSPIAATSIRLNYTALNLVVGDTQTLTATVQPDNVTDPTVEWASGNVNVATVDAEGKVTAVGVGTAMITAKCGSVRAYCVVTVNPVEASAVTLSASSMSLRIGDTQTLTATVQPDNTTDKTVTWSSDNTDVATVDADGTVTAVGVGTATITATCGSATATCYVNVGAVDVTGISLSAETVTMHAGEEYVLEATVQPENVTYPVIGWSTSDATVAVVDANGKVTAVNVGTAVITAACGDVSATCTVEVLPIAVESIVLNETEVSLHVGEAATLVATVQPDNATDKTVTWTSSDADVVTVNPDGTIEAIALGTATVTATAGEATATCTVNVLPIPVAEVVLSAAEIEITIGETALLMATVLPDNATDKTVTWATTDEDIVTVDADGNINAVGVGEATVIATADGVSAECKVTVLPILAENVVLDTYAVTLEIDDVVTITAIVLPDATTDKTVTWTSSDETIATVDADGQVTAIAAGTVEITAVCGEASATCVVTVNDKPEGICDVTIDGDTAVDVYNVQGMLVKRAATSLSGLPRGVYIVRGQKYYVK